MMSGPIELSALRSRGRRCPWYRDALDLVARPGAPYDRWIGTAMVFAGSQAWKLAEPARTAGQRAVTLLPPGAEPEAMRWPPVRCWIGDCGDLDAGRVVRLAQVLVGAGALRLHLLAKNVDGGLVNVKVMG